MAFHGFQNFCLLSLGLAFLAGCSTSQQEADVVNLARVDTQRYQPITRLAFVKTEDEQTKIAVIRHKPLIEAVSDIETAAGQVDDEIVEH